MIPASTTDELAAALAALRESLDIPTSFPADVVAEAERVAAAGPADAEERTDLTDLELLTIDPEGSTDLDQAVHLTRTPTGAVLHYAIADVAAFVAAGGAIDREARERGQTLYPPDGRVPLHPPVLSEDAASLLPDQVRPAYVWKFVLDEGARPTETTLTRALVRSRRQWTYVDAQAAIDAGDAPETLAALPWFGAERAAREIERGGASLNLPETRVRRDGERYVLEPDPGVALEDHNAQVSLLTGMAAAEIMIAGGIGILRTMPPAPDDAVEAFRAQTRRLGLPWAEDMSYGAYLQSLDHSPVARAVREHAAGLFRGAGYVAFDGETPADPSQAAIGAPYAHTTAPLRRLVDRWSLAICEALANGREVPAWARESLATLPDLMEASTQRARQLESGALSRVEAAVLQGREGEEFEAVVLRTREDGAQVAVTTPPVEVTVRGLSAAAGTVVTLRLESTSIAEGRIQFTPVGS